MKTVFCFLWLREYIERAGTYYELSVEAERIFTRFIDLWISMEVLFSPSEKEQLRHSIAQNVSSLLWKSSIEKREIYRNLKALYDKRGELVHGGKAKEFTQRDIKLVSSYVSKSLIKLSVLQMRGKRTIKQIHELIE